MKLVNAVSTRYLHWIHTCNIIRYLFLRPELKLVMGQILLRYYYNTYLNSILLIFQFLKLLLIFKNPSYFCVILPAFCNQSIMATIKNHPNLKLAEYLELIACKITAQFIGIPNVPLK